MLVGGGGADLLYGKTTSGAPDGVGDTVSYEDGRTTPVVRCVVPNVKTMTVARRLLRARHCTLGQVRRVYSRKVRKGWIVSQSHRPGARLPRNAKVNIVVSRGRRR